LPRKSVKKSPVQNEPLTWSTNTSPVAMQNSYCCKAMITGTLTDIYRKLELACISSPSSKSSSAVEVAVTPADNAWDVFLQVLIPSRWSQLHVLSSKATPIKFTDLCMSRSMKNIHKSRRGAGAAHLNTTGTSCVALFFAKPVIILSCFFHYCVYVALLDNHDLAISNIGDLWLCLWVVCLHVLDLISKIAWD